MLATLIFQIVNGVVQGAVLALIATGLCLLFGLMNVVNIAHGSMYMLGAVIGAYALLTLHVSFWWALVLVPLTTGALAVLMYAVVFKHVVDEPMAVGVLATTGLSLVIDNTVLATFGGAPESILNPAPGVIHFGGVYLPTFRLVALGLSVVGLGAIGAFLKYTKYGLWMRAMSRGAELSRILGVPVKLVNFLTVVGVGVITGFAGVAILPVSGADFQMGLTILAATFIVVVVGGLENIRGVVVVSMCYGVLNGILAMFASSSLATALTLLAFVPALYLFPNGVLGAR